MTVDPALRPRRSWSDSIPRAVLAAPAAPFCLLATGLAIAWVSRSPWPLWLVFGAVAGYSLSGST
jgi:hypothetical protein